MNIAAVMAALAIRDLGPTAKGVVVVVACRADQDTTGAVPVAQIALDLNRHPGAIARILRAIDGRYLVVDKSVVSLGDYFGITSRASTARADCATRCATRCAGHCLIGDIELGNEIHTAGDGAAGVDKPRDARRAAAKAIAQARDALGDPNRRRRR